MGASPLESVVGDDRETMYVNHPRDKWQGRRKQNEIAGTTHGRVSGGMLPRGFLCPRHHI